MRHLYILFFFLVTCATSFAQNALNFDGVNDYVTSNYPGITGNNQRTVEAWIKTTVNAIGNQQVILDMGTMTTGTRFTVCVLQNNSLRCEVGGNGIVGTTPVNDGNWHHIAVTFDPAATNDLKLYIDGNLEIEGNFTVGVNTSGSGSVEIGRRNDGINHFTGSIDEVRVWDVARTQVEIQADMNNEMCNTHPNLKLYYRFNEGVANGNNLGLTQTIDDSGNGYTGTLSGFALNGASSNWVNGVTLGAGMTTTIIPVNACDSYTWLETGQTYTASGNYSTQATSTTGCDSTLVLDLTIYSPNDLTTNQTVCDSFVWNVNGQTYYASTSVTETLTTTQGCAYQHTLNLIVNNGFDTTYVEYACDSFYWEPLNAWLTIPGQYPYNGTAANGCDSTIYLVLNIENSPVVDIIQETDGSLSTTFPLQLWWYDCSNDSIISSATGMNFMPTYNSSYAAIGADWMGLGCKDTSDCIVVDYLSLLSVGPVNQGVQISPNPTDGVVQISVDCMHGALVFEILDASGKTISEKTIEGGTASNIELDVQPGVYLVRALTEFGWYTERIVKW